MLLHFDIYFIEYNPRVDLNTDVHWLDLFRYMFQRAKAWRAFRFHGRRLLLQYATSSKYLRSKNFLRC